MTKETKENKETKPVDPSKDIGNYLIQVVSEDGDHVLKQVIANNCTIRVVYLGEQSLAVEVK